MRIAEITAVLISLAPVAGRAGDPLTLPVNRVWDVLPEPLSPTDWRETMARAAELLDVWPIYVGGVWVDGERLLRVAEADPHLAFTRVVREQLRRPFDVEDLLLFLDDVLLAGEAGWRGKEIYVPASRARSAGILLHPDDVFHRDRPRLFASGWSDMNVDRPVPRTDLVPARDGEILGPNWVLRYPNPSSEHGMLAAMERLGRAGFAGRVKDLMAQLETAGCDVNLASTVRNRTRGYLMWGAFALSRANSEDHVKKLVKKLNDANREWRLRAPIRWMHPAGWEQTVEMARQMADTYDVVFATENGARRSHHYDGSAVDITVMNLPAELTLVAPSGEKRTFDLSAPEQPRDLSLTVEVIAWIEKEFQMQKLASDHPHWSDTQRLASR